jgi:hypothetical protein
MQVWYTLSLRQRGGVTTRLVRKIAAALKDNGTDRPGGADNTRTVRTHASRANVSAGAWCRSLRPKVRPAYYTSAGSAFTATEVARGPCRVMRDERTGCYDTEPA